MIEAVSYEQLEQLASEAVAKDSQAKPPAEASPELQAVLDAIIQRGIKVKEPTAYKDGRKYILNTCLFDSNHGGGTSVAVIEYAGGAKQYSCMHNECKGKKWGDLLRLLQPEAPSTVFERGSVAGPLTEERLAQAFETQYRGKLLFDHQRLGWYVLDGQNYWVLNETRRAFYYARQICRSLNVEAKKEFARAGTYSGVETICQRSPTFAVTSDLWNPDIWLLGTPGDVVDLRTGEMRPARAEDYITKRTRVIPDFHTNAPVFAKFFDEITRSDSDLQRFLQRIVGSGLTGSTRDEKLIFLYGPGGNGKGKFVNAISDCAGDYAATATMDVFVERRGGRQHTTDLAMLAGARLVTASETKQGHSWDEELIKRVTGRDPITCRFLYHDNFTFMAQFTLIIVGNFAPELASVNEANRRRFIVVPFTFKPKTVDEHLPDKLREEYPAILAWMIRGARDWYENGLGELPQVVKDETEEYFEEQNRIGAWVEECCSVGENHSDTSAHLYQNYVNWCKRNHAEPITHIALTRTLGAEHGCKRDREATARRIKGIAVKVIYEPDPRTGERDG